MTTATTPAATQPVKHVVTATLEEILAIAFVTPMDDPNDPDCMWGAPTILWGEPGIGKSERVAQAGNTSELKLETLYLSGMQPEDIGGIPLGNYEVGVKRVCDLTQVQNLTALSRGILFLDELTTARPAVQNSGLAVVHERMIAGKRLPGGVRVMAAANPPEDTAGGWNLTMPMANRFIHIDVKVPTADEWCDHMLGSVVRDKKPATQSENLIKTNWVTNWPLLLGQGCGFVKRNADVLFQKPAPGHPSRGKAWASPRSWETALRGMAAAYCLGKKELAIDVLDAAVGSGPCAEFAEWVEYSDLPDPKDVLDHGWRVNPDRLDINYAVLASATQYALAIADKQAQHAYVAKMYGVLADAIKDGSGDVAMFQAKLLMRAGYTTKAGGEVARIGKPVIAYFGGSLLADQL
jgi:hypothetical protein